MVQVLWVDHLRRRHTVCRSDIRSLLCNSAVSQIYIPEDLKPHNMAVGADILNPPPPRGQWVHLEIIHFSLYSLFRVFCIVVIVILVVMIFAVCFMTVVSDIFAAFFYLLVIILCPLK